MAAVVGTGVLDRRSHYSHNRSGSRWKRAIVRVAVIDIGKPGKNLGWAVDEPPEGGSDLDKCIDVLAAALAGGPLALGFEAPQFIPLRTAAAVLTAARDGECGPGMPSRPFSASGGATVLVTSLVIAPYVLSGLRRRVPSARATFDWRVPVTVPGHLLLFEAFVTDQRKTGDNRHVEDARLAIGEFRRRMADPVRCQSSVTAGEPFNLLAAALLRTGWSSDASLLREPCLVLRTLTDKPTRSSPP